MKSRKQAAFVVELVDVMDAELSSRLVMPPAWRPSARLAPVESLV
jgi:hypothetical protein